MPACGGSLYLQGGRHEEVLLLETQLLALIGPVIRVQDAAQGLRALLGQDGCDVVT